MTKLQTLAIEIQTDMQMIESDLKAGMMIEVTKGLKRINEKVKEWSREVYKTMNIHDENLEAEDIKEGATDLEELEAGVEALDTEQAEKAQTQGLEQSVEGVINN